MDGSIKNDLKIKVVLIFVNDLAICKVFQKDMFLKNNLIQSIVFIVLSMFSICHDNTKAIADNWQFCDNAVKKTKNRPLSKHDLDHFIES